MKSSPLYQELRTRLSEFVQFLPDKPEETADSTLHALWHRTMDKFYSAPHALTQPLAALDPAQQTKLREWVQQRIEGVPLSHITERQRFMGLEMLAGAAALVPRAETELLAGIAIELARGAGAENQAPQRPLTVIDVCTGSGNVALAIAHHVPAARVFAADLSEDAVALARRNAQHLGLEERTTFRSGDLLAPFDTAEFAGQVDVLTCNPPYISSAKVKQMPEEISAHEPMLAFDGGPFGVSILMRLLNDAPRLLRGGGWLAFEVGLGQGPALAKRLQNNPVFTEVRALADASGDTRAIAARRVQL